MSLETLNKISELGHKFTPMMEQYYQCKKQYPDALLFFRMGDFYELFFDDAVEVSKRLNITLTHRGSIGDIRIPMAGIPHHAATSYVDRLAQMGLKVAIAEQLENPKEAQGVVKRGVTQIVSPSMPFDLEKVGHTENHYIVSTFFDGKFYYISAMDFTVGEFFGHQIKNFDEFLEKINIIAPKEFVTYMGQFESDSDLFKILKHLGTLNTYISQDYFDQKYNGVYIQKFISTYETDKTLQSVKNILSSIGPLCFYVTSTQKQEVFTHIRPYQFINDDTNMKVSLPTLLGIEVLPKSRDRYHESLLGFFDKTKTAMGSRFLRQVFTTPSRDKLEIEKRYDLIDFFIKDLDQLKYLRDELSEIRDLERIMAKVSTGKANSSDLLNTAGAINRYFTLSKIIASLPYPLKSKLSSTEATQLQSFAKLVTETINDEIGASLEKGNLIKAGANKDRDKLAALSTNAEEELIKLENKYKEETGILKLKIKANNVNGFFIEITKSHSDKVPKYFERRQTLVNAERYTTKELSEFENEVISSKSKLEKLEREIFKSLIAELSLLSPSITTLAYIISFIDSMSSLAWVSHLENFSRPVISETKKIHLEQAFHPLIKASIKDSFTPHDLTLNNENYFGLITGPNMAGKTTVMREVAIIQLLAQVGSFVPAKLAEVSICDYLFSRLGASDDILRGQSTFMVEMSETAEIIRHATDKSLIILDEVGRGTSTYDGLSIAWALVEHFVNKTKALALFATHYHELIEVIDGLKGAKNLTVETINQNGKVQFMYRLIEQGASQSFGIYVAKLAGLPQSILKRSEKLLGELEKHQFSQKDNSIDLDQLSLFETNTQQISPYHELIDSIQEIDINNMTPIMAFEYLNQLKVEISSLSLQ